MNNCEENNILKTLTVQVPKNTKLGTNNLVTFNDVNVELPAGTLLQNGNVRIPIFKNDEQHITSVLELMDINNINCYKDQTNSIFYTIPENLNILNNEQITYCKLAEGTIVKFNDDNNNIKFATQQDEWICLYKNTKIKFPTETLLEFRINGSWYKIKTFKIETFSL